MWTRRTIEIRIFLTELRSQRSHLALLSALHYQSPVRTSTGTFPRSRRTKPLVQMACHTSA